jgi:hypothetical protein
VIRGRLRRIPWVDVRWVSARLPDRLVIAATYRRPVLLWRTTVATYTVDALGTVLYDVHAPPVPRSTVPTTATLPLVYSPHDTAFSGGSHVPPVAVRMVLATRAELTPDIARSVSLYRWSPYSGLTVHSRRGWWFLLGSNLNGALQQRLEALTLADNKHDLAGCNYVDLRPLPNIYCTDDPAWRGPLGPGAAPSPAPGSGGGVCPLCAGNKACDCLSRGARLADHSKEPPADGSPPGATVGPTVGATVGPKQAPVRATPCPAAQCPLCTNRAVRDRPSQVPDHTKRGAPNHRTEDNGLCTNACGC